MYVGPFALLHAGLLPVLGAGDRLDRPQGSNIERMRVSVPKRQCLASIGVAAVLLVFSAASCGRHSTDTSDRIELTDYLYVHETSGQKGGMPTQVKAIYLSADGVGQLTEETTNDTIVRLWTSTVRAEQLLRDLSKTSFGKQSEPGPPKPTDLLTEYTPPTLLIEALDADGKTRSWEGDPKRLPVELASVVEKARRLVKSGDRFAMSAGTRYIRATVLTARAANDMREAGVLREAAVCDMDRTPLVRSAITHPRMLVCVDAVENPYGKLGVFSRGRSVALSIDSRAFQVRNLEKADQLKRKENIE